MKLERLRLVIRISMPNTDSNKTARRDFPWGSDLLWTLQRRMARLGLLEIDPDHGNPYKIEHLLDALGRSYDTEGQGEDTTASVEQRLVDDFLQNMLTRLEETETLLEDRQVTIIPLPRPFEEKPIYVICLVNASGPEARRKGLVMGASIALSFFDALWLGGDASDATAWDRLTLRWPTVPGGTDGRIRLTPVQQPITMLFVNHAHDRLTEFQSLKTQLLPTRWGSRPWSRP